VALTVFPARSRVPRWFRTMATASRWVSLEPAENARSKWSVPSYPDRHGVTNGILRASRLRFCFRFASWSLSTRNKSELVFYVSLNSSKVPRDADGKVRFAGDVALLRPTDDGNGRALLVVPNRGMASVPFSGLAMQFVGTGEAMDPGDGYLLDEGWMVALPGWQWDVPDGFLGLTSPVVDVDPGWMRADLRFDAVLAERSLNDVIPLGAGVPPLVFGAYPTADVDDPDAVLRVRVAQMGPSEIIPRPAWSFTSPTTIALEGGFQPQRWYELVYRCSYAPVVEAGLLAVRDFGAHLRDEHAGVFAYGQSQSGRFLRELLFEGLNLAEDGRQVFDGLLAEIASAQRGEFNRRYAQPGLAAPMMPEYGPPYDSSSLLGRQRGRGGVPKVFFVNSAAGYWRGDGALVHQDAATGADLPEDPDVRAYLVSGTDHIGNMPGWKQTVPLANPPHLLDQGPVVKALFVQLQEWALDGGRADAEHGSAPVRRYRHVPRERARVVPREPQARPGHAALHAGDRSRRRRVALAPRRTSRRPGLSGRRARQ
jgi:alpha/beta hydrolase family protein